MGIKSSTPFPDTPSLSNALADLRSQSVKVADDMRTIIGIIDNAHTAGNTYEILHRLKSILGREAGMTKMLRRWIALLEPLEVIAVSLE